MSFLIFVDELAKLLERHSVVVKLFADDVKVYLEICNVDDVAKLQKPLDLIAERADRPVILRHFGVEPTTNCNSNETCIFQCQN